MASLIFLFDFLICPQLPRSVPRPWAEGSAARGLCAFYFAAFETPSPEAVPAADLVASPLG